MSRIEGLQVWQVAREIVRQTYAVTATMRDNGMRDQMRRASVSIVSNIAEGAGRAGKPEFRQFLSYARGSCDELRTQLLIASDIGCAIDAAFLDRVDHCGRMLTRLIRSLAPP